MINVWVDELTPCLRDAETNELVDTEVLRIKRKSFLQKYSKKNGWYVNWADLVDENEIYALVIQGTMDIQGLIAVKPIDDFKSIYVTWMCTAPENNKMLVSNPKYKGVGGHLFAIAAQLSCESGYGGAISGFAADKKLLEHYCEVFNAEYLGILHSYQFFIAEEQAGKIREAYNYVWTDDEL